MENPSLETKEKKKISKIHFLIHPGFDFIENPQLVGDLLLAFLKKAETLKEDELMFAFPWLDKDKKNIRWGSLKSDANEKTMVRTIENDMIKLGYVEPYLKTLQVIKKILGKRLIVISDPENSDPSSPDFYKGGILDPDATHQYWNKMVRLANARGYYFDSSVESEAYGEFCNKCVAIGAGNLNLAGKLNKKTIIVPELTELHQSPNLIQAVKDLGPAHYDPKGITQVAKSRLDTK